MTPCRTLWTIFLAAAFASAPNLATNSHAQTPSSARLTEWDVFAATGGDGTATQNIASVALDASGVAGPAGSVWLTGKVPAARLGRLDPATNSYVQWQPVGPTEVGGAAMGVALNAANGEIWMAIQGTPSFVVKRTGIDTFRRFRAASPLVTQGIVVASDHSAIAALPSRSAAMIGNAIIRVPRNGVGDSVTATLWNVGGQPHGVALDSSGRLWFTQRSANTLARLNLSTGVLDEWPLPAGRAPTGVVVSGGTVCAASEGWYGTLTGVVQCLDVATNRITRYARAAGDGFDMPEQLSLNSDGEIFVTEQNGNSISFVAFAARSTAAVSTVTPATRTVAAEATTLTVDDVVVPPVAQTIVPTEAVIAGVDNGSGHVRFPLAMVPLTYPFELEGYPQPLGLTAVLNDQGRDSGAVFFSEYFDGPVRGRRAAGRIGRLELIVPPPPPSITVSPTSLQFTAMSGVAAPGSQTIAVTETNGQPLSWTASKTAAWMTLSAASGSAPASINITVDHSSLTPGTYSDVITIDDGPDGAPAATVSVEFEVAPPSPVIALSPSAMTFSTLRGRSPSAQTVVIENSGSAPLNFTAGTSTTGGGNWLLVSPASGTVAPGATAFLTVTVGSGTLASGSYSGTIAVADAMATNSPQAVSVSLTVSPAPTITLLPTALTFTGTRWTTCNGVESGSTVASQTLAVGNSGDAVLNYAASASGGAWLSVSPASGAVSPGATGILSIAVDIRGLARGTYTGTVTASDPNATNASQSADVTLTVGPAQATLCVTPESIDFGTVGRSSTTSSQILQILNVGDEPMGGWNATATASRGTVNLSSTTGSAPDTISVSVTSTSARGGQTGAITITAGGAANSVTINLTWTVN